MTPLIAVISMGPHDRRLSRTAWDHGHPRDDAVTPIVSAVRLSRGQPVEVRVAEFEEQNNYATLTLTKAVFATGWNRGRVVVEARGSNGWLEVFEQVGLR